MASGGTLEGKRALVTGASRGIGRAIAARLAAEGASVACGVRSEEDGPAAVAVVAGTAGDAATRAGRLAGEVSWVHLDVTDPALVATAVERAARPHRRIDVVVNNAGINGSTPLSGDASSDELWHAILDVNLSGTWRVLRAVLPFLPDGGRVVNVSSVAGRLGFPGGGAYGASKHALVGLTRVLANELAPRRITVNAVCPGWVDTDLGREVMARVALETGQEVERAYELAARSAPLGAVLSPAEVAGLVAWLSGPDARNVTGQAISVDGGTVMP